jgi:hypothetical protein
MQLTRKKPWPKDCLQIIASVTSESIIPEGEAKRIETCADCGAELTASQRTFDLAMRNPSRFDRPVRYVCVECGVQYDINSLDELHDHRGGDDRRLF